MLADLRPALPLVTLRGVGYSAGGRDILRGVDMQVAQGDFVAVTGPNGGGKTTLLRIMLGLLRPTAGSVATAPGLRDSIGYLPQKTSVDARFPVTVGEVVAQGLLGLRLSRAETEERLDEALRLVELEGLRTSPIGEISGGQLQRALLARALAGRPRLLVLDEPLSYLDKRHEHTVYALLERVRQTATIVLVSHEMSVIAPMANVHLIVDHTVRRCPAAHHLVHYDC